MKKITDTILDLVYPVRCPVCNRILIQKEDMVCRECEGVFRYIKDHYCMKCGKPVKPEEEYCHDCRKNKRSFTRGRSVFLYGEKMKQSLLRYKYHGNREYVYYYGKCICTFLGEDIRMWNPDLIIPIPLSKKKRKMRGFNQAEELGRQISEIMGIPLASDVLIKIHDTRSQKKLDAGQRKRNLKDAFRVTCSLKGLTVLLADDVYTTGSTVEAAAECLRKAGAGAVYFVTLSTGMTEEGEFPG